MQLSVVIVNYNVRYFLEQCLYSLQKALRDIPSEVIVVDNHSADDSVTFIKKYFPEVLLIANTSNAGFARACNQGLKASGGRYVLFLNPDTILGESTISSCLRFFKEKENAGAVGVRMVDGAGRFLKESKRAFPSPLTSLFKLFGLAYLFPRSGVFSRYHLGHLDDKSNHEVDVLAGAFMMVRREVLDKVGSFDEDFFMYGEDIDLSYRIQKAGYKNYYFAEAEIIHFKGESTKRGSLNYVRMFYSAMNIFVRKHFGGARARIFRFSIQIAILLRAIVSISGKFIRWLGLPVVDAALILLSFWLVKEAWVRYVRTDVHYPEQLLIFLLPSYTMLYLLVAYYAGLYNRFFRTADLLRSTGFATLALLSIYALLPEHLRFSRGILFFGALGAFGLLTLSRKLMLRTGLLTRPLETRKTPFILVAGTTEEYAEVMGLLKKNALNEKVIGRLAVYDENGDRITEVNKVNDVAEGLGATDLILCAGAFSYGETISFIQTVDRHIRLRFHAKGSEGVVGSDSNSTTGEVLTVTAPFHLAQPHYRRLKRLLDFVFGLFFLLTFPFHLLLVRKPVRFFLNCWEVLVRKKTWVGYHFPHASLPPLRPGILTTNGTPQSHLYDLSFQSITLLDEWYAMEYEPMRDCRLILKRYMQLGG